MPGSSALGAVYQEPSNITEPVRLMDLPVRRAAVRELVAEVGRYDDDFIRQLTAGFARRRSHLRSHLQRDPRQSLRLVE